MPLVRKEDNIDRWCNLLHNRWHSSAHTQLFFYLSPPSLRDSGQHRSVRLSMLAQRDHKHPDNFSFSLPGSFHLLAFT